MSIVKKAIKRSDKRIALMRQKYERPPNEVKGAVFSEDDVADELGITRNEFDSLMDLLGDAAIEALLANRAPAKAITEGLIVQGLFIGQELLKLQTNDEED